LVEESGLIFEAPGGCFVEAGSCCYAAGSFPKMLPGGTESSGPLAEVRAEEEVGGRHVAEA
jgi:hypothetical protein